MKGNQQPGKSNQAAQQVFLLKPFFFNEQGCQDWNHKGVTEDKKCNPSTGGKLGTIVEGKNLSGIQKAGDQNQRDLIFFEKKSASVPADKKEDKGQRRCKS